MARSTGRTPWTDETKRLVWTMSEEGYKTKEIVRGVRNLTDGEITKTPSAINTLVSKIRRGKEREPERYEAIPEKALKKSAGNANYWTDEQKAWLLQQRNPEDGSLPRSYDSIVGEFNQRFGTARTRRAIEVKASEMRRRKSSSGPTYKEAEEGSLTRQDNGDGSLIERLASFDARTISPILERRRQLVYSHMAKQADKIRNYDALRSFARDGKVGIDDLLSLDSTRKRKLIELLKNEQQDGHISIIELFSMSDFEEPRASASVILPVYVNDVLNTGSSASVSSCLNDAFYSQVSSKTAGLSKPENRPFQDRFEDLIMYNIVSRGRTLDYGFLLDRINEQLGGEYPGLKVEIVQDRLFQNSLKREE